MKEAIRNMEQHLKQNNCKLYTANQPMHSNYVPELDVTPLLNDEETNFFQSQMSILRCMVELGRSDTYIQVAMLSSYLVQLRQGHMEAIYYLYGYLKSHDRSTMVFDMNMLIGMRMIFHSMIGRNYIELQGKIILIMHHHLEACQCKSTRL